MPKELPIVYSAHHASHNFGKFSNRCALTLEQRVRYSDYGTDDTVPKHTNFLISSYSRGLIDLNRAPNSPTLYPQQDFGKPQRNNIWIPGHQPSNDEKIMIRQTIYEDYHQRLLSAIQDLEKRETESRRPIIVVAWDNTAHYQIGNNSDGSPRIMQSLILSNDGDRGRGNSTNPEVKTTCNPNFLEELARNLRLALRARDLIDEVYLNTYDDTPNDECGYIARHYNTYCNPGLSSHQVEAFQVEYDTLITHSQEDLCPNYKAMEKLRLAFEEAMETTYRNLFAA